MGAIAEAIVAYAQPLLDQSDGSLEQLNKAMVIAQFCYNLALSPVDRRETMLGEIRRTLEMDDEEFDEFRRSIVVPMIERHEEMFPFLHRRGSTAPAQSVLLQRATTRKPESGERFPGTDRYAPCPCNSGEKYKFCCGAKGR